MLVIALLTLLLALPGAIVNIYILTRFFHEAPKQAQLEEDFDGSDV